MAAHERVDARLLDIQVALANSRVIVDVRLLHESAIGDVGYFRVRAHLIDGSEVKFMERFCHQADTVVVEKYSFHWQRADGSLIRRWDNAPHHPEITSFPNHLHEGDESHVLAHEAVNVFEVLVKLEKALAEQVD
ncbi:MAG: DUF6516 family protein [Gallionella sp.]|nr:DUF6516 family protein [Gallionella sp.]